MKKEGKALSISAIDKLGDELNKHVVCKIILQAIPVIWAGALKAFKTMFYLDTGNMNRIGIILSIITCLISVFFIIVASVADKRKRDMLNVEDLSANIAFREILLSSGMELRDRINKKFESWANNDLCDDSLKKAINGGIKPIDRIEETVKQLKVCLSDVCGIDEKELYTSAAISITQNKKDKWEWLYNPDINITTIDVLLKNKSTFALVAKGEPFIYIHDKKKESKKGRYFLDAYDASYDNNGSIICFEVHEDLHKMRARVIISINTYGKKIIDSNDRSVINWIVKERIRGGIIRQYEHEIKEDLLWILLNRISYDQNRDTSLSTNAE